MPAEKCERCWSRKRLVAREVTADERVDPSVRTQTVTLCEHCVDLAPEDALLFWEVFMRFSSVREFVRHYEVGSHPGPWRRLNAAKRSVEPFPGHWPFVLKGSARP